ncbi:MAG: hypothetical protein ACRD5M_15645 [Candidatus Acidiferrales bacterium]
MIIGILLTSTVIKPVQEQQSVSKTSKHGSAVQQNPQPATPPVVNSTPYDEFKENRNLPNRKKWDWHEAIAPQYLSNWALVLVGIGGFIAAVCTLRSIGRQTGIANRAYLAAGEPRIEKSEAHFPVWNYGHVAGRIINVEVEILVQDLQGKEKYRDSTKKAEDMIVVPGEPQAEACALNVSLPKGAILDNAQIVISTTLIYDTGFNQTDTLNFVRVYMTNVRKWVTAAVIMEVSFPEGDTNKMAN